MISGLDDDLTIPRDGDVVSSAITGYTEWVSPSDPTVSIGWDWELTGGQGRVAVRRVGDPRHNVMCVEHGRDAGSRPTCLLIARYIAGIAWQPIILGFLAHDHGMKTIARPSCFRN